MKLFIFPILIVLLSAFALAGVEELVNYTDTDTVAIYLITAKSNGNLQVESFFKLVPNIDYYLLSPKILSDKEPIKYLLYENGINYSSTNCDYNIKTIIIENTTGMLPYGMQWDIPNKCFSNFNYQYPIIMSYEIPSFIAEYETYKEIYLMYPYVVSNPSSNITYYFMFLHEGDMRLNVYYTNTNFKKYLYTNNILIYSYFNSSLSFDENLKPIYVGQLMVVNSSKNPNIQFIHTLTIGDGTIKDEIKAIYRWNGDPDKRFGYSFEYPSSLNATIAEVYMKTDGGTFSSIPLTKNEFDKIINRTFDLSNIDYAHFLETRDDGDNILHVWSKIGSNNVVEINLRTTYPADNVVNSTSDFKYIYTYYAPYPRDVLDLEENYNIIIDTDRYTIINTTCYDRLNNKDLNTDDGLTFVFKNPSDYSCLPFIIVFENKEAKTLFYISYINMIFSIISIILVGICLLKKRHNKFIQKIGIFLLLQLFATIIYPLLTSMDTDNLFFNLIYTRSYVILSLAFFLIAYYYFTKTDD